MSSNKSSLAKEKPGRMSRRDAMTLTAAVAAFGSVLGFAAGSAAEPGAIQGTFKIERMVFKFYSQDSLLATYVVPENVARVIHEGKRVSFKFFRNDKRDTRSPIEMSEKAPIPD